MGDAAHGSIHTSARVASEELTCDQIMQVSEIMAQAISVLADEVEQTVVHATYGNHLRTVQNKNDSIHADNMERLIPWWLEQRLRDRSDIVFPESEYYEFLYFSVCGYNICAAHGDLDNVKNAGKTLHTLFAKKYSSDIDYVVLADKHHKEEFEELGIESMIAPCLCGTDDYAIPVYWHSLRHFFTTSLAKANLPDSVIKTIIGWESLEMVDIYKDIDDEDEIGKYCMNGEIVGQKQAALSDL